MSKKINTGRIGIITGAGPEAGMDLWKKMLYQTKAFYSENYRGDLDAPHVVIHSIPELGHVMNIDQQEGEIWECLKDTILQIDKEVDYFCIACNILHFFTEKIRSLPLTSEFISIVDSTNLYLKENSIKEVALLSIGKVVELGKYSPYVILKENFKIETPDPKQMNALINGIKIKGADDQTLLADFHKIVNRLSAEIIILACTELPLLNTDGLNKKFIDPTAILAQLITSLAYKARRNVYSMVS